MEKERNTKIIAVVALLLAVIGVSVGFASWTATLTISDATATVTKGEDSTIFEDLLTIKSVNCDTIEGSGASVNPGTIEDGKVWKNAEVKLTKSGDSVTCTANVENASEFKAYLNSIELSSALTCEGDGQNVSAACTALELTVTGTGTKDSVATATSSNFSNATDIGENYIAAKANDTNGTGTIAFKLAYVGSDVSDTDFTVTIPTMTFNYATTD